MAGEFNKKRPADVKGALPGPEWPMRCRKLLCNSLLHSLTAFVARQLAWLADRTPHGLGFMLPEGDSRPEKREKAREIEPNAAQEMESAGRIAVPVLSFRGKKRPDPETVMEMAQRHLF